MRVFFYPAFLIISLLSLSGCLGTRFLDDDEKLLYRQKIKGNENVSNDELRNLFQQEPNRKLPLVPFSPYVYLYQIGLNSYDQDEIRQEKEEIIMEYDQKIAENQDNPRRVAKLTTKKVKRVDKKDKVLEEGNIWMRWGEPLAVYDTTLSNATASQMKLYLNSKGYFNSNVSYQTDTVGLSPKRVKVTYNIEEGEPYLLDTVFYRFAVDSALARLIYFDRENRLFKLGENYEASELEAERERLDALLKNNGYYDFSRQYIEFDVDTAYSENGVGVIVKILPPSEGAIHKSYRIDSVIFTTDQNVVSANENRHSEVYDGVTYKYYDDTYSKKILDRRLFISPDSIYSRENTVETQRQLANLDMFKFINVNYDTSGGRFVANIFTSPLKKFQTSNEIGIGVNINEGFPGPFYNVTFKNRNIFGGLEVLEITGRAGIEGVSSVTGDQNIYRSEEVGGNVSLIFPQFVFPLGANIKSRIGNLNPKTRVLAGYSFINRPEYRRTNLKSSITYTWQKQQKVSYNFSLADISLINTPELSDDFAARLDTLAASGSNLNLSFARSFVSSMIFSALFNFNQYGSFLGETNKASYLKTYIESGGTSLNLTGDGYLDRYDLQSFKYFKINADFRRYLPVSRTGVLAYRINVGFALPYGENRALPYEKYFFAGGANSIRAWRPRRLGPGSYTPPPTREDFNPETDGPYDYRFEQPGEILLETSIELRRNIVGFLDGAVFVDAGNVWSRYENKELEGGEFDIKDFYKEIAVGTGLGFRFDFSFLLIRFDLGIKVFDPARPEGERFVLGKVGLSGPYSLNKEPIIFNFGIGYPF